jgi:hypothetical protein
MFQVILMAAIIDAGVSAVAVMPYTIKDFFVCVEIYNLFRSDNFIGFRNNCGC